MRYQNLFEIQLYILIFWLKKLSKHKAECLNHNKVQHQSEQKLLDTLFYNYNNKIKPSGTVQVKLALHLIQIIDIVEKDQIMVINAFVDHYWHDGRLEWDPKKHGNLTLIRMNSKKIWTPDTFIYSSADNNALLIPSTGVNVLISYDGQIFWPNPLNHLKFRCSMDISWFPFDEQLCVLVFGSWSYSVHYLNYTYKVRVPSLVSYSENNVWQLVAFKSFRNEVKYETWIENDAFSEVIFKILVRRKPLFVLQNSVIPAAMLSILTLISFFIPFGPTMQIGISIMLAFSVFKLRLSDDVPIQSNIIPLINIYFTLCMTFSLSAMIWFSIKNLLVEKKKVPKCIRYIVLNHIWHLMLLNYWQKYFFKKKKENTNLTNNINNFENIKISSQKHKNSGKKSELSGNRRKVSLEIVKDSSSIPQINQTRNPKGISIKNNERQKILENKPILKAKKYKEYWLQAEPINGLNRFKIKKNSLKERKKATDFVDNLSLKLNSENLILNSDLNFLLVQENDQANSSFDKNSYAKLKNRKNVKNGLIIQENHMKHGYQFSKNNLTDVEVIQIINMFIFFLFLIFITMLHLLSLYICPIYMKKYLSIDE